MYEALYRKYRPRVFDDVLSQRHVTTPLRRQLQMGRTAHAYLFTGARGTGKTTCARILAKAVNCEHLSANGNPCLLCPCCKGAEAQTLPDIIEIDAASSGSADDVRRLREETAYLPQQCQHKIYIIDEVHLLSPGAWGALLKIMEEPPAHVKFILATTEIHKVPATIISRCQRYDFRRIKTVDIQKKLLEIARTEGFPLTDGGAETIAYLAEGGMRDALSLLDQCASFGGNITRESVTQIAGAAGQDSIYNILDALNRRDGGTALKQVGALYEQSKDMVRLCDELIEMLRNLMLCLTQPGLPDLLTCPPNMIERVRGLSQRETLSGIFRQIDALGRCRERMSLVPGKRVELEMTLLQLMAEGVYERQTAQPEQTAHMLVPPAETATAVETVAQTTPVVQPRPAKQTASSPSPPANAASAEFGAPGQTAAKTAAISQPAPSLEPSLTPPPRTASSSLGDPVRQWPEILAAAEKKRPDLAAALRGSAAFVNGDNLNIAVGDVFSVGLLKREENRTSLLACVKDVLGRGYRIRAGQRKDASSRDAPPNATRRKVLTLLEKARQNGVDVEVEDGE